MTVLHDPPASGTYSAITDDALGSHDLVGLVDLLAKREVNPSELVAAARARAADSQPILNAVTSWVDQPTPRDDAGPLAGIPTFLKDNEQLAGLPTREGSRAVPAQVAERTSRIGSLFEQLGATFLGKSSMPEFGLTATTEPLLSGPTHNPWALGHSAGGSSGGAAALVAAGVVPWAHANDGGGSIRIPAACCGLVGLKPSRGRLPNSPEADQLPIPIVTQGVLTRSVRDTALILAEAEKRYRPAVDLEPIGLVQGPGRRRLRVGFVVQGPAGPVSPEVASNVRSCANVLDGLGHHVDEVDLGVTPQFGRDFLRYWAGLAFALKLGGPRLYGPDFATSRLEPFTLGLGQFFRTIALGVPASLLRLRAFRERHAANFETVDVVLSPTIGSPPPPLGYLSPDEDFRTHATRLLPFAGFTAVQNVAGTPAINVPVGTAADGRPIGVQLGGPMGSERVLLELAFELEQAVGWAQSPPRAL
ncbi:MAG: amidase [Actinobacteria bacterium]|nr:amidase [Actinomycetota bacterium]